MLQFSHPLTVQLAPDETLRWTHRRPGRLHVLDGRVWLTRSGDAGDHFLHAGDSAWLHRGSGVLIGADGPTCVRLESPAPAPGLARRLRVAARRWLQGIASRGRRSAALAAAAGASPAGSRPTRALFPL